MLVGASYYPETLPCGEWKKDLATARDLGLYCLRCGEFSWSAFAPQAGAWQSAWAREFLDLAAEMGFAVIWCTPSATPPPYVFERWPELAAVNVEGRHVPVGVRRNYCPSHAGYRRLAADMARRLACEIGAHPAVIGWQVDNEIAGDGFTCWCDGCEREFRLWLQERYSSLDGLNGSWQSMIWSQWYTSWAQIPLPRQQTGSFAPALKLACRRFRSDNWLAFFRAQACAIREVSDKPVGTNFFNYTWDVPFDLWRWCGECDALGLSHYLEDGGKSAFQLALLAADETDSRPLWILEQKAGQQAAQNLLPEDPQRLGRHLKLCARAGAKIAIYWHLRQHSAGCEMEHGAILRHDGRPGRIAQGVAQAIKDAAGETPSPPPRHRCMAFSYQQHWANEQRPPQGLRWNYMDQLQEWHTAGNSLWGGLRIDPAEKMAGAKLVIAPHMQMHGAETGALLDFVRAGGILLTTADFARLDGENNVLRQPPGWALGCPPDLEVLHLREEYPLRARLAREDFRAGGFWAAGSHQSHMRTIGSIDYAGEESPLLLDIPYGAGRVLLLMAMPEVAGKTAVLRHMDELVPCGQ